MSEHRAEVIWNRGGAVFTDNHYSRGHRWRFDGGVEVPASSSPQVMLRPEARFLGASLPDAGDVVEMHRESHERCLIARSVKTAVSCEPVF